MVAHFLTPELAAQYLAQADLGSPTSKAAAAAATIAAVEDMGARSMSPTAAAMSPFGVSQQQQRQQQDSSSAVEQLQQQQGTQQPGEASTPGDTAATQPFRPASSSRDRDRPLLSSMSMQLQGRYGRPGSSSSPSAGSSKAAAAAPGDRQARALTRFTALSAGSKWRAAASAATGLHTDGNGALESTSADAADVARRRRSSVDHIASAAAAWEGGPAAAGGRSSSGVLSHDFSRVRDPAGYKSFTGGRGLGTMSMIPAVGNARVARALEGMAFQPEPQQQQQQQGVGRDDLTDSGGSSGSSADAAVLGSSSGPSSDQRHPKIVTLTAAPKIDPARGFYSDEQLQAAAAAAADQLTLQQQSLLFDLLKIRQLVNKAAAKFDQQRLTAFLDAAAAGEVDVVQDMLRQGMSPNTSDYDGRTALMIAAYKGHKVCRYCFEASRFGCRACAPTDRQRCPRPCSAEMPTVVLYSWVLQSSWAVSQGMAMSRCVCICLSACRMSS